MENLSSRKPVPGAKKLGDIRPLLNVYLGGSLVLAIVKNTAKNLELQISQDSCFTTFRYISRSRVTGSSDNSIFLIF